MYDLSNLVTYINSPFWKDFEEEQDEDKMTESLVKYTKFTEAGQAKIIRTFLTENPNPADQTFENFKLQGYYDQKDDNGKSVYWTPNGFEGWKEGQLKQLKKMGFNVESQNKENPNTRPELDLSNASNDLKTIVSLFSDSGGGEKSVSPLESAQEKYNLLYKTAYRLAIGRSLKNFAFICGDAGIGKSYSVSKALKAAGLSDDGNSTPKDSRNPQLVKVFGSIGNAKSSIAKFFFENRNNKVILMDDADGFLMSNDQDTRDILKGLLDPDGHPVTVPDTIRDIINRRIQREKNKQKKEESRIISFDTEKLNEGIFSVLINGRECVNHPISFSEQLELQSIIKDKHSYKENYKRSYRCKFIENENEDDEDEDEDEDDNEDFEDEDDREINNGDAEIPSSFLFNSRIIFISNLLVNQVDEAISSRCDVAQIVLTPEEFLAYLKVVLPNLCTTSKSLLPPEEVEWAKKNCYVLLCAAVEASKSNVKLGDKYVIVNIPLEFRLMPTLMEAYLRRADDYIEQTGEKSRENVSKAILKKFIYFDLLRILAGDVRNK